MICNSKVDQEWGEEVRLEQKKEDFPFRRRRTFDLLVYCEDNRFVVYEWII